MVEDRLTITPRCFWSITRSSCFMHRNVPDTLSERECMIAFQLQHLACLRRGCNFQVQRLENRDDAIDLLRVARRELARAIPERVLETYPNVAAHRGGHGGQRNLAAARTEHGPEIALAEQALRRPAHVHDVIRV